MRFAVFVAVLAALASPAHSQNEDSVVVTATRFADDARRMAASVTVLTRDDIAKSAARNIPDLLSEQVGLSVKDLFGSNGANASVDMRGFGATGPQNTLILVDGRRYSDIDTGAIAWSSIPLANVERIEILRGTGAVLYGDGASAGAINIVTRSPQQLAPALGVAARVASFRTHEGHVAANFASPGFGLSATAHGYASDGYRANSRNEQRNFLANARWIVGPGHLDLRLGTDATDAGIPGSRRVQPSSGTDEYATNPKGAQTPLDYSSRDGRRAGIAWNQQFRDTDLSIGLDWRDRDSRAFFVTRGVFRADSLKLVSLTPRVRVPFSTGDFTHRLTVGIDSHSWRYASRQANRPENVARPINFVRGTLQDRALYLSDSIALSAATTATVGWRSERVRIDLNDTLDPAAPGFFFNTGAQPASAVLRARAGEIGLRHAFLREWTGYARVAQSFRFARIDEIYETDLAFNNQFQILRPQRALTHEIGAEWRETGRMLRTSLFTTRVIDELHLDPFTAGMGNTNLPPSRRQGLELEGRWQTTPSVRVSAVYSYTSARFLEGILPGGGSALGANLPIGGKNVPLVPAQKFNLGMVWEFAAKTRLTSSLAYVGSQFMENDEPNSLGTKIPAYTVADVKLAKIFGWGAISLAVNNLFDRKYYNYAVRNQFNNAPDRYAVFPLPGRTVGVSAEFSLQ